MKRRRRLRLVIVAVLLAIGVGALFKATDALPEAQLSAIDTLFDLRGTQDPPSGVVVVGIDDRTLEDSSYPLNRRRHARVIQQLTEAGASVIAVDIQFTEPGEFPDADTALIEAVRASRRVVLATTEVAPDGSTAILGGGETLEYSRAIPANGNLEPDEDGVLRRFTARPQGLESFAFAAVRRKTGETPKHDSGSALIDFPGPAGSIRQLSFRDVEYGSFDPKYVRGKIVVVGATSAQLQDLHRTATDPAMPGPEVQAAAIATALASFPLDEAPDWLDWLLIVALAAVAPLVGLRFGTAIGLLAWIVAIAAFAGAAVIAFGEGVVVSVVPPLAAAFVALVGTLLLANPVAHPRFNRFLDVVSKAEGMNQRTRRLRAVMLLGTAVSVAVLGLGFQALDVLKKLEYTSVDRRFDIRGQRPPGPVVVVGIDDKTFDELELVEFPFTRNLHARAIRQLAKADPKVIVYDVQFTERSGDPDADTRLIEATRAARNVVLSTTEIAEDGSTNIFGGGEILAYSRGIPANGNILNDGDGRIRRFPFRPQRLDSLATAALGFGAGIDTPAGETAWIDYAGQTRSVPYISFGDVVRGKFDPAAIRGKYVVVGGVAPSLQDRHSTSTTGSGLMPGPEIWAHAINTGLRGFPLHTVPWWVDALLLVLLAVAAPLAALRARTGLALGLAGLLLAAFLVAAQLAFNEEQAILAVATPVIAAIVAIAATAAIHGLTVAFERANTRDAFARFVPESVVDQVLEDAEGVRLGGVRGEATVMFSDLRGFTSFAETLEPEQVIAALNRYLTAMSEAILDHGGTLVAYMGDGIMAVFGAPLKQDDHADRALAAARDMLDRLDGFNQSLRDEGLHEGFKMGIGLNSGPVMSGNVGSERRLEYTALGDTTNTAARLEGMTKGTPHQLFLADSTHEALTRPADDLIEVGEFEVRGRKATIKLWSLAEPGQPAPPEPTPATAGA
jgi:adenylate cyclase